MEFSTFRMNIVRIYLARVEEKLIMPSDLLIMLESVINIIPDYSFKYILKLSKLLKSKLPTSLNLYPLWIDYNVVPPK